MLVYIWLRFLKWNCGYGMDIDCQNNPNDPFLVNNKKFFAYGLNLFAFNRKKSRFDFIRNKNISLKVDK